MIYLKSQLRDFSVVIPFARLASERSKIEVVLILVIGISAIQTHHFYLS